MLLKVPVDKDFPDGKKIFNKIKSELNGIDLFNITCMTADNFPCNYNMFNDDSNLSKSISIHKYYKITFKRDDNEFDEIKKYETYDHGFKSPIGTEIIADRIFDYNCNKNKKITFKSSRFDIGINDPNWTPHQKYMIEFNKILGKFVYNEDTEYDKYFKGDILHTTLYHAKLNNLTVLSNKKSPDFAVYSSSISEIDAHTDADELEDDLNKALDEIKKRESKSAQDDGAATSTAPAATTTATSTAPAATTTATPAHHGDLSSLKYNAVQKLCKDTKEQGKHTCSCAGKGATKDKIIECLKNNAIVREDEEMATGNEVGEITASIAGVQPNGDDDNQEPKLAIRSLSSINFKTTCYLNAPLISLLAFKNTHVLNQLHNNVNCSDNKFCSDQNECNKTDEILKLLKEVNADLINNSSEVEYGEWPYSNLFHLIYPDCCHLGLKKSAEIGAYGEAFQSLDFLLKLIYCKNPEKYTSLNLTNPDNIITIQAKIKAELTQSNNPDVISIGVYKHTEEPSLLSQINDLDLPGYKVFAIIVFKPQHYTTFLYNNNDIIYFDANGGTKTSSYPSLDSFSNKLGAIKIW